MLMEDKWHPRDIILAGMEAALGKGNFTAVVDPEEFPWDALKPAEAIFVSQKGENQELPDGSKLRWITAEREKILRDFVAAGGSALFIHCGTVLADAGEGYQTLVGGNFLQHPKQCSVTYAPLKVNHPILEGVGPFTVMDEHYHCQIDITKVTPLLAACSQGNAGTLAAWCQEIGKGRTVALCPGHTLEAVNNANAARLVANTVKWLS
ncbi:hypothetical protein AGMMS49928_18140 [Spirochaetia bacterium]|nr:hypothetical protein AGMMS49928_18140 [Spirochaetia bacterium]